MGNYEQHYFADHNLPIIFHFDRVFKGREGLPHWHENIELLYCVSGAGEAMVESRPVPMRQGCLTVINSSQVHYTRLTEEPFGYYCLIVDSGFLEQMELYVEERELDEFVQSAEISARFERIIREMEEKRDYDKELEKKDTLMLPVTPSTDTYSFCAAGRQNGCCGRNGTAYRRRPPPADLMMFLILPKCLRNRPGFCPLR